MTTVTPIRDGVLHRYIFEIRYDYGQVFLDRAGRVARDIVHREGWEVQQIDPNGAHVALSDQNVQFSFNAVKLDLVQTQSGEVEALMPVSEFATLAQELSERVVAVLELDSFSRIGFRLWTLYPANNRKDADETMKRLRLFHVDAAAELGIGTTTDPSYRVVFEGKDRMFRVAITPFEQQVNLPNSILLAARQNTRAMSREQHRARIDQLKAQKMIKNYPHFGILLDLDAFIEYPQYPDPITARDFVMDSYRDFEVIKPTLLAAKD